MSMNFLNTMKGKSIFSGLLSDQAVQTRIRCELIALLVIIAFSSCTKLVYISKKTDPEINLEPGHHKIVFVNFFNYISPENVSNKNIIPFHVGVINLTAGLSSFSNDSTFSFSVGDTLRKSLDPGLQTTLLDADTVKSICSRFNANLLLSLDSVSIFFDRDTVINYYFGASYRTINFYLNTVFYLSLYSADGELIDRSEADRSENYVPKSSLSGFYIRVPTIQGARNEIANLAFQAGQDYVNKFYPQMTHDTKQLFTGSIFKESNDLIFAKNWSRAIELLDQLAKNQDPDIAEKAQHNLDVAKEAAEADERK
jgi:hypothetical protein